MQDSYSSIAYQQNDCLRNFLYLPQFSPDPWKGLRVALADEFNEFLPDVAAEAPGGGCIGRADQCAELHRLIRRIGDLQDANFPVPQLRGFEYLLQLLSDCVDRHGVVNVNEDRTEYIGGGAGPILEGFFDEVGNGHDQAALVP